MDLSSSEEHRALQNQRQYCGQLVQAYGAYHQPGELGAPAAFREIQVPDRQVYFFPCQEVAAGGGLRNSQSVPSALSDAAAAAVEAFSQLAQIAGTMDAAEKAGLPAGGPGIGQMQRRLAPCGQLNPQLEISRSPFIDGGGRRRGLSFTRGGRGRRDCGRGRKRGKARRIASSPDIGAFAHENENADNKEVRSPAEVGEAPGSQQPTRAWCELCQVECTSLQMLEQHSSGKRHKKNLEKVQVQPRTDQQFQHAFQHLEITPGSKNGNPVFAPVETVLNSVLGNPGIPMQPSRNLLEGKPPESAGHGMKRKMKGGVVGVGNKRIKNAHPHKPKVVIPLICDICNIRCDTKEVLDCHFSGKKHIAKLKRFEDQQARCGLPGFLALYQPNNPITDTDLYSRDHQLPAFDYGPQTSTVIAEAIPYSQDHQLPSFGYDPQTSTVMTETTYSQDPHLPAFGYDHQTSTVITETTPYSQDPQLPAFGYGPQTSTVAMSQTYPGIATAPSMNPSIQHYYY